LRSSTGYRAKRISISRSIDQNDSVCILQRLKQNESTCSAVQAFYAIRQFVLLEGSDHMNADPFVAHDDVAEP
jgi:hypothetical protein